MYNNDFYVCIDHFDYFGVQMEGNVITGPPIIPEEHKNCDLFKGKTYRNAIITGTSEINGKQLKQNYIHNYIDYQNLVNFCQKLLDELPNVHGSDDLFIDSSKSIYFVCFLVDHELHVKGLNLERPSKHDKIDRNGIMNVNYASLDLIIDLRSKQMLWRHFYKILGISSNYCVPCREAVSNYFLERHLKSPRHIENHRKSYYNHMTDQLTRVNLEKKI